METRFPNAKDGIPDHDSLAGINAYASRRRSVQVRTHYFAGPGVRTVVVRTDQKECIRSQGQDC